MPEDKKTKKPVKNLVDTSIQDNNQDLETSVVVQTINKKTKQFAKNPVDASLNVEKSLVNVLSYLVKSQEKTSSEIVDNLNALKDSSFASSTVQNKNAVESNEHLVNIADELTVIEKSISGLYKFFDNSEKEKDDLQEQKIEKLTSDYLKNILKIEKEQLKEFRMLNDQFIDFFEMNEKNIQDQKEQAIERDREAAVLNDKFIDFFEMNEKNIQDQKEQSIERDREAAVPPPIKIQSDSKLTTDKSSKGFMDDILNSIFSKGIIGTILSRLGSFVGSILSRLGSFAGNILSRLGSFATNILSRIGPLATNILSRISSLSAELLSTGGSSLLAIAGGLAGAAGSWALFFKGLNSDQEKYNEKLRKDAADKKEAAELDTKQKTALARSESDLVIANAEAVGWRNLDTPEGLSTLADYYERDNKNPRGKNIALAIREKAKAIATTRTSAAEPSLTPTVSTAKPPAVLDKIPQAGAKPYIPVKNTLMDKLLGGLGAFIPSSFSLTPQAVAATSPTSSRFPSNIPKIEELDVLIKRFQKSESSGKTGVINAIGAAGMNQFIQSTAMDQIIAMERQNIRPDITKKFKGKEIVNFNNDAILKYLSEATGKKGDKLNDRIKDLKNKGTIPQNFDISSYIKEKYPNSVSATVASLNEEEQNAMFKQFIQPLIKAKRGGPIDFADIKSFGFASGLYTKALTEGNMNMTMYRLRDDKGNPTEVLKKNPFFADMDTNNDGILTAQELRNATSKMNPELHNPKLNPVNPLPTGQTQQTTVVQGGPTVNNGGATTTNNYFYSSVQAAKTLLGRVNPLNN